MRPPDFDQEMRMEADFGVERLPQFVEPYYLELAGFGAAKAPQSTATSIRRLSKDLDVADVRRLLHMHWRPRVMGAWFAVAAQDDELSESLHDSLESCLGHLTAPSLIVGVVMYPTARTVPLLMDYANADLTYGWGAATFAVSAALRLDPDAAVPGQAEPQGADGAPSLDAMLTFAERVRGR